MRRPLLLLSLSITGCSLLVSTDGLGRGDGGGKSEERLIDGGGSTSDAGDGARVVPPGGVVWAVNGHIYLFVEAHVTWSEAELGARQMGGHLVTITSREENEFAYALARQDDVWLGARQASGSTEPRGGWEWITGEPFVFTAWAAGRPNNGAGTGAESVLQFFSSEPTWDDEGENNENVSNGYIVEIE